MIPQPTQMIMNNHTPQSISSPSFISSVATNTIVQQSFTPDQQKMGHTEMGVSQHLTANISEQPALENSAVSIQLAVFQLSYSLQRCSILKQLLSSSSPASSSSQTHQLPPASIIQALPLEQHSQSSSTVPPSSFVDSPPQGVGDSDESGLPPPFREKPDSGLSVGNAEQSEEEEGLVASLATANAVIEEMDMESKGDSHTDIPNHASLGPTEPPLSPPLPVQRNSKISHTTFSQSQVDALELAFHVNPYPSSLLQLKLSCNTGMPVYELQVWFQKRRYRGKRLH